MQISWGKAVTESRAILVVLAALALVSCSMTPNQPPVIKADQPFATAGSIEMQLARGDYSIQAGRDEHIRVSFAGNYDNAAADLSTSDTHANLAIKDTPRSNFRATIEVPATVDVTIHLTAGNLEIGAIRGNKDIDSQAGNVGISIPNSSDYGTVDAAVSVGDLDADPFSKSGSGVSPHVTWSGSGKYTLRASLGAGNLELKH